MHIGLLNAFSCILKSSKKYLRKIVVLHVSRIRRKPKRLFKSLGCSKVKDCINNLVAEKLYALVYMFLCMFMAQATFRIIQMLQLKLN